MSDLRHAFLGYLHFPARCLLAFLYEAMEQYNHTTGLKTVKNPAGFHS
jgi:uncharacterized protein involved in tellurium resistance